jgi:hypothetical protein
LQKFAVFAVVRAPAIREFRVGEVGKDTAAAVWVDGFPRPCDLGAGPPLRVVDAGRGQLVLGVKNRAELGDCLAAAERGPLSAELAERMDEQAA